MITGNTSLLPKSDRKITRSPLFYVGDKYKLLAQLLDIYPEQINKFIEPFTGGGSVAMNVAASQYLLNDIDSNIVAIHQLLKDSSANREAFFEKTEALIDAYGLSKSYQSDIIPSELRLAWKKTYYAKFNNQAYKKLRDDYNSASVKDVYKLYLLLIYGFNRMIRFNAKGEFNLPVGNVDFNKNVIDSLNAYFDWADRSEIAWANMDYADFIQATEFSNDDFLYLDPPYLITFSEYNKLWNVENEKLMVHLLDDLHSKGVKFAVSNVTHYKGRVNEVFLHWSKKYNTHPIKSNYISYHDNSVKDFREVLITNLG